MGEPTEYNSLSFASGAHIMVHNKSQKASFNSGILIATGTLANIAVSREFSSKLKQPFSECIEDIESYAEQSVYVKTLLETNYGYSQNECFSVCFQQTLVDACHCYDLNTPFWNKKGVRECLSLKDIDCFGENLQKFFSQDVKQLCPECPLECESVSFSSSVSAVNYPSAVYGDALKNNAAIWAKFGNRTNLTLDELRRNILAINIFYSELSYKKFSELEKMSVVDLIAAVGGTLGLFLGMSFLSFVEIIDLAFHLLLAICQDFKTNKVSNIT